MSSDSESIKKTMALKIRQFGHSKQVQYQHKATSKHKEGAPVFRLGQTLNQDINVAKSSGLKLQLLQSWPCGVVTHTNLLICKYDGTINKTFEMKIQKFTNPEVNLSEVENNKGVEALDG